jgi:hypothetical protein
VLVLTSSLAPTSEGVCVNITPPRTCFLLLLEDWLAEIHSVHGHGLAQAFLVLATYLDSVG